MRRRHLLPAGTVFMALVIALGGLGVAYGLWTDLLEINGTVSTGTVDVTFDAVSAADNETGVGESKEVGTCDAKIVAQEITEPVPTGSGSLDETNGTDKVEITIANAYPGYICDVTLSVKNVGTIPVKLDAIQMENVTATTPAGAVTITRSDGCWTDGLQLHKDETTAAVKGECKVRLEVNQSASEDTEYTFVGQFFADQWNEYTTGN